MNGEWVGVRWVGLSAHGYPVEIRGDGPLLVHNLFVRGCRSAAKENRNR